MTGCGEGSRTDINNMANTDLEWVYLCSLAAVKVVVTGLIFAVFDVKCMWLLLTASEGHLLTDKQNERVPANDK